jgi:flagellar biosynthesis anti-sigma factor FlgM
MRISSNNPAYVSQLYQINQVQAEQADVKATEKTTGNDSVQLSDQAKAIHDLMNEYKNLPDIRDEKVAQIKESITNNTYNVTAQQLAAKMLTSGNE